ncbi:MULTISPECIES: hypothetical protein [Photorhabdus]|uniref:Uncharacterized protein n=2 Tax=Photorhabdus TaxID=29487 RepID=A0A0F7LPX4_9GAMM|nr:MULTISPECIES: hypothetical protein [Photorhabdus]NHB63348.1 hypothetical protein [Photorhabdus sp. RW14-46]AKH63877.1 hypothetical protein VY86_11620 [Photorhabdus thracensis]KOY60751.1 hypothetical protein AM629_17550 [Photorhabdus heterorhabditis]MBS9435885.1 hypothetical protein [Photorhabdus noenieputensis]MCK3667551.1 hypothetical protein [Photorhabdus noenieputensis]
MSINDTQSDITDLIINAFRRDFWLNVQDALYAKYAAAQEVTVGNILKLGEPEQRRFRPQARHYGLNSALREAASRSGYLCYDADTSPKGEHYIIIDSEGVKISRIGLNHDERHIRGAKHRSLIAQLNEKFEGYTPDLFREEDSKHHNDIDTLGVLLININPPYHESQASMMDLRIVVPFTNMKGFHYNKSVTELLALYTGEKKIVIPDMVLPKLKKRLKDQEK